MKKHITNAIVLIIIGVFSLAYFNDIATLPQREKLVVQGLMAVILVLLVIQSIRSFIDYRKTVAEQRSEKSIDDSKDKKRDLQKPIRDFFTNKQVLLIILAAAYMIMFPFIGFFVTSFVFVLVVNYLMGTKSKLQLFAIPAGLLIFVYILFILVFDVRLPAGILI